MRKSDAISRVAASEGKDKTINCGAGGMRQGGVGWGQEGRAGANFGAMEQLIVRAETGQVSRELPKLEGGGLGGGQRAKAYSHAENGPVVNHPPPCQIARKFREPF